MFFNILNASTTNLIQFIRLKYFNLNLTHLCPWMVFLIKSLLKYKSICNSTLTGLGSNIGTLDSSHILSVIIISFNVLKFTYTSIQILTILCMLINIITTPHQRIRYVIRIYYLIIYPIIWLSKKRHI